MPVRGRPHAHRARRRTRLPARRAHDRPSGPRRRRKHAQSLGLGGARTATMVSACWRPATCRRWLGDSARPFAARPFRTTILTVARRPSATARTRANSSSRRTPSRGERSAPPRRSARARRTISHPVSHWAQGRLRRNAQAARPLRAPLPGGCPRARSRSPRVATVLACCSFAHKLHLVCLVAELAARAQAPHTTCGQQILARVRVEGQRGCLPETMARVRHCWHQWHAGSGTALSFHPAQCTPCWSSRYLLLQPLPAQLRAHGRGAGRRPSRVDTRVSNCVARAALPPRLVCRLR